MGICSLSPSGTMKTDKQQQGAIMSRLKKGTKVYITANELPEHKRTGRIMSLAGLPSIPSSSATMYWVEIDGSEDNLFMRDEFVVINHEASSLSFKGLMDRLRAGTLSPLRWDF